MIGRWFPRIAVPAQVRQHYREALRELRSDLVPHDMRLRIAVEQQQRPTPARDGDMNLNAARGIDFRA